MKRKHSTGETRNTNLLSCKIARREERWNTAGGSVADASLALNRSGGKLQTIKTAPLLFKTQEICVLFLLRGF